MKYCMECSRVVNPNSLSRFSLIMAGTDNPIRALLSIDEEYVLCRSCELMDELVLDEPSISRRSTNEDDYGEWSGIDLDEAKTDWVNLNW